MVLSFMVVVVADVVVVAVFEKVFTSPISAWSRSVGDCV